MKLQDILNEYAHILPEADLPPPPLPRDIGQDQPPAIVQPAVPGDPEAGPPPMPGGAIDPAMAQDPAAPMVGDPAAPPAEPDLNPTPMTSEGEFDYVELLARAMTTEIGWEDQQSINELLGQMEDGELTADQGRAIRDKLEAILKKQEGRRDVPASELPPKDI